jgi:hypothetical protein
MVHKVAFSKSGNLHKISFQWGLEKHPRELSCLYFATYSCGVWMSHLWKLTVCLLFMWLSPSCDLLLQVVFPTSFFKKILIFRCVLDTWVWSFCVIPFVTVLGVSLNIRLFPCLYDLVNLPCLIQCQNEVLGIKKGAQKKVMGSSQLYWLLFQL